MDKFLISAGKEMRIDCIVDRQKWAQSCTHKFNNIKQFYNQRESILQLPVNNASYIPLGWQEYYTE